MNKAVFLDRDGTIIIDRIYLNDVKEIEYLPNVFEALRSLRDAGYIFIVVTNQSGIARGLVDIKNLYAIHEKIREDFARGGVDICGFYYAPYGPETNHPMRKPNPGMLLRGAQDFNIDLKQSWMIGDRFVDVDAGRAAGARPILLLHPPRVEQLNEKPDAICESLTEAANFILSHS